jgi:hypothetical protein
MFVLVLEHGTSSRMPALESRAIAYPLLVTALEAAGS